MTALVTNDDTYLSKVLRNCLISTRAFTPFQIASKLLQIISVHSSSEVCARKAFLLVNSLKPTPKLHASLWRSRFQLEPQLGFS